MTAIEWTDATWNPVTGCSKVSPGCDHCYAETLSLRFGWSKKPWTPGNADENVLLRPDRLTKPLSWRAPRMVFVNSMSDLFHVNVPPSFIDDVFETIAKTPQHTYQILTKRPQRMADYLDGWTPLPNVWLGVSIESWRYNWRANLLARIPAAVRFISAEPLLETLYGGGKSRHLNLDGIAWVIVGGESGTHARPMDPDWARDLRDACLSQCEPCATGSVESDGVEKPFGYPWHLPPAGYPEIDCTRSTAFFFKQWGGRTPKSGGRTLDGRTWNEFPQPATTRQPAPAGTSIPEPVAGGSQREDQ